MAQARRAGAFTRSHDRYLKAARRYLGDAEGTRALIEVLLAHRHLPADAITTALDACVDIGVVDPEVVIVEARRHTQTADPVVVPIGSLTAYDRPAPDIAQYDQLLQRKTQ